MDDQSFEECVVTASPEGFGIAGYVTAAHDGAPLVVRYGVDCDVAWSARFVAIEQRLGNAQRRLRLERSGDGWLVDGVRDAQLDGCAKPDLGLTRSVPHLLRNPLDEELVYLIGGEDKPLKVFDHPAGGKRYLLIGSASGTEFYELGAPIKPLGTA